MIPFKKRTEKPNSFLQKLLKKGLVIADIGCGRGFYAQYLIKYSSMLYCVDIDKESLKSTGELLEKTEKHYKLLTSTRKIRADSVDVAFLANSFHDIEDKRKAYTEILRILKRNGMVIVIDWKKNGFFGFGPPPQIRMDEADYLKYFKRFKISKRFYPGKYHFGIVLKRKIIRNK
ncbi:MAG: class I SAM-dependent methyltransferase [Candidatus Marsarchaeota archaeon]|nr:class I SAM-dependent methyltransferase [Candidatus Marsarchaeota archaeon]